MILTKVLARILVRPSYSNARLTIVFFWIQQGSEVAMDAATQQKPIIKWISLT